MNFEEKKGLNNLCKQKLKKKDQIRFIYKKKYI